MTVGVVMVALLSSCSGSRTVSAPEPEQRADATNLLLTGVGGLAQTSVLVATALLATASLTLVMVCLGVCIHTTGTWSNSKRLVRSVPPRSDRTSA